MDHPECDCNNHIEEALAHVCSSNNDSNNGTMGKYEAGRQRHAGGSCSCWQLHFPILVERMRVGEWVEKGCLSISQYDQCMWGNWEST